MRRMRSCFSGFMLMILLLELTQPTVTLAKPPRAALPVHEAALLQPAATLPLVAPGTVVTIPDVVVERLAIPAVQPVQPLAATTHQRMAQVVQQLLPCWSALVDEVIVLRHPAAELQGDHPLVRNGMLAGVVAIRKTDETQPFSVTNLVVRLYLFLPAGLLSGTGLDYPLTCANVIPYAAPVPQTLGDFLDWTLAHETWHLIESRARIDQARQATQDTPATLDDLLTDPAFWRNSSQEAHIADLLGWVDYGEQVALSDELAPPLTVRHGQTTYHLQRGVVTVTYQDAQYAFERSFIRTGYLSPALMTFADLTPLLQSGRYPTLYALFNGEQERFAEYGAWFWFALLAGEPARFQERFPEMAAYYTARWQTAIAQCEGR